jgi:hypothetical protein
MMIETWTGEFFDAGDAKPDNIKFEDIAHGLSVECRYGNQGLPYTVAEHCVLMSRALEDLIPTSGRLPLLALLHDAAEAYLSDIPSLRKTQADKDCETNLMHVIWRALDIKPPTFEECQIIQDADHRIIIDEKPIVMPNSKRYDLITPLGVRVCCWSHFRAKEEYLKRYEELTHDEEI